MPKGRIAEIVVLGEDRAHIRFIASWLSQHIPHGRLVRRFPLAGGSGEQFVRERFPIEAEFHRRNSSKRRAMLVTIIDADAGDAEAHYLDLKNVAHHQDGIFIFVPKHCIETWLHHLNGHAADENYQKYRLEYKSKLDQAIPVGAAKFLELVRAKSTEGLIPSLRRGIEEAMRMRP